MPDDKKGHRYLHKPAVKSLLFVLRTYDLFLPSDRLKYFYVRF